MNVTGLLRVDLSPFVDDWGCLLIGDSEIHAIYRCAGSFVGSLIVDVGPAVRVTVPDRCRLAECWPGAGSISVVGGDARGVVAAVEAFRAVEMPSPRGPEVVR